MEKNKKEIQFSRRYIVVGGKLRDGGTNKRSEKASSGSPVDSWPEQTVEAALEDARCPLLRLGKLFIEQNTTRTAKTATGAEDRCGETHKHNYNVKV